MKTLEEKRDYQRLYMQKYRQTDKHKNYQKDYHKIYYEENKDLIIDRSIEWVKLNSDRAKLNFKNSYERNRDNGKRKEQTTNWIKENLAEHRAYQRAYQAARRAKIKCVEIGEIDFAAIKLRCAGCCGICDLPINGKFEYDHIVPIARGGSHTTNNLQLSHMTCNRQKSDKLNFKLKIAN